MAQTTTTRRIAISAIAVTGLISGCSSTTQGSGTLGRPGAPTSGSASTPHLDKKWQRRVGGGPGSNTQLTGGSADAARIYINDVSGDVYALAASSGAVQWHARPGTRTGSAVSVEGGVVLYYDSNFHTAALDPATGRVLWSRQNSDSGAIDVYHPAYANGVLVLNDNGDLRGVAVRSGRTRWTLSRDKYNTSSSQAASDDSMLYAVVGMIGRRKRVLLALEPATGKVGWTYPVPDQDIYTSYFVRSAHGLVLLLAKGSNSEAPTTVTALDARTHVKRWSSTVADISPDIYTPAQIGHTLVYPTLKGLRGISLKDGSTLFTTKVEGSGVTKIGSCGGLACAVGLENLVVIGADGKQLAATKTPGGDPDYPILFGAGKTYLYSSSTVYALG